MNLPSNNDLNLLGHLQSVFRWRLLYPTILVWLAICLTTLLFTGLSAIVLPILMFFTGLWVIWELHPRLILYENGFIKRSLQQIDICYWHQIWLIHDFSDRDGNPTHLTITQTHDFDIRILPIYSRFTALATAILQAHIRVNHEYAMNTLQSGKSVQFGPIQLFSEYITVGTRQIPLATIKTIRLDPNGRIQLQVPDGNDGKLVWMYFSESWIPNRHLLQHLILSLQGQHLPNNQVPITDSEPSTDDAHQAADSTFPTKTYRTGAIVRLLALITLTQFAILGLIQFIWAGLFFGLMVFLGLVGAFCVTFYYLMRPDLVTIDPAGITSISKSQSTRLKWTEITEIIDQNRPLTRFGRANRTLRLVDKDSATIDLPPYLVHRDELIKHIHDIFADLHLPNSIQALDNGETLTFGPCTLNAETLTIDQKSIPIADIATIHINRDGSLDFHIETPQESKHITATAVIPNRHLLIDIITHLRQRAESTIIYPDVEEIETSDHLQFEDNDDPTITANFDTADTLESTT